MKTNRIGRWVRGLAAAAVLGATAAGAVGVGSRECSALSAADNGWQWLASPALSRALSVLAGAC